MPDAAGTTGRELDLVLVGATGFTGRLVAEYVVRHAPAGLRWALAGRSVERLEAVRSDLSVLTASAAGVPLVVADATDPASLAELARRTRLVVSTVGPYLRLGEPLVAACAAAGTDYADLTGEPEFVDRMYLAHHATAVANGSRIVHACGFDSVPYDVGAWFTVQQLPEDVPVTMRGVVRAGGMFSGGTLHSALAQASRRSEMRAAARERRRVEPRPVGRSSRAVAGRPHRDRELGRWLLPLPTIDPIVVARSGAALQRYGPDFRYSQYAGTRTLRYAAGGAAAVVALGTAAAVPPVRAALTRRIKAGDGPDQARRERSWFTVDFVAEAGGRTVHTRVSGGDPGYDEAAKMMGEAAMCLLLDDLPEASGQVTTVQAMGEALLSRLQAAGIHFEVL